MIFVLTFVAALTLLVLNIAGVIAISFWWILAVWPGIWLAFWITILVIFGTGFGVWAAVENKKYRDTYNRIRR